MMSSVKQSIISLSKTRAANSLVRLLEMFDHEAANLLRVLTYHRVDYPSAHPNLSPATLSATPEDFAQQMDFIRERYTPVSIQDVLGWEVDNIPPRAVLVTFDDAYRDFAEHAWPIAQERDIPLTLFVPTGFPDQPERVFWWDELYNAISNTNSNTVSTKDGDLSLKTSADRKQAFRALRDYVKALPHEEAMSWVRQTCHELGTPLEKNIVLSWEELRDLASEGVTMGAHTRTHPMMNRISLEQAREEAVQSRVDIQEHIGSAPPIFAYPSGFFSDSVVQMLRDEGFQLAFTTDRGINQMATVDRLRLRRINVGGNTTLSLMRGQLLATTRYIQ